MQRVFVFQDQLTMSEGVSSKKEIENIVLSCIPGAVRVERANITDDRNGIDYKVTIESGRIVGVDVKVRDEDWSRKGHDDVALEIWSMIEQSKIGWTRNIRKRTDYILWIWKDTGRWMLIPFPMLCSVFVKRWQGWSDKYKTAIQQTKNPDGSHWKSECVFVPRREIWSAIFSDFGGTAA